MKLIIELIEFALEHNMLTEEHKLKLQNDGLYTFYDNEDEISASYEPEYNERVEQEPDSHEDVLDQTYYDDFYDINKRYDKRHRRKRISPPVAPELTVEEFNQRVEEEWKKLTEEFPRLAPLWESWKTGKLMRVLADGFTLNDVYALTKVELPDFHDSLGPVPVAYRQLLRQVGNAVGKYSWVIKCPETASMVEFPRFRQQIFDEVRKLFETDRERFATLSSQNGKLNFPSWENAVQIDTTSMKVWAILNLTSEPVTPERIEAIQTWKPELAITMQINLDYITELIPKLEQSDWSSLMVITECEIENGALKSVALPEGVMKIGVVIPKGVTAIGDNAFRGYDSLTSVVIPEGVTAIGKCAFCGCRSLTSVAIPEGVATIGYSAFQGCRSLKSVAIPKGVTIIGYYAFKDCYSLTSVVIPEGVKEIRFRAFQDCSSLKSVALPEGLTYDKDVFQGCAASGKALLSADGRILLDVNYDISGIFVVPESVKVIAPQSFEGCRSLSSVVFPKGLKEIGKYAFRGCSSLTSVVIPEGVTTIGNEAFSGCSSVTSVVIPEGVKSIGWWAFEDCRALKSVAIPESMKWIGNGTFKNCSSLMSVTIPKGVTSIGEGAFNSCISLTSVVIPEGVERLGTCAFSDCESLTFVTMFEGVKSFGWWAFGNSPNLTIHAPAGSYAEKYAKANKIPFQSLEEE